MSAMAGHYGKAPYNTHYWEFWNEPDGMGMPSVVRDAHGAPSEIRYGGDPKLYADLLREFGQLTGVPVLVNTSFNVRGEPIVCTPAEAYNCFSHTDIDYLVLGDYLVSRAAKRPLAPYAGRTRIRAEAEAIV